MTGEFRRTKSKVWWSNTDSDESSPDTPLLHRQSSSKFNFKSPTAEESDRNSSSSPSNGSQKSQDSGFSDSESSAPSSKSSGSDKVVENADSKSEDTPSEEAEEGRIRFANLPETPVGRIPRPYLIKNKNKGSKNVVKDGNAETIEPEGDSISTYLADCYFPVNNFLDRNSDLRKSYKKHHNYLETILENTKHSVYQCRSLNDTSSSENRTCFIVDELPKISSALNDVNPEIKSSLDSLPSKDDFTEQKDLKFKPKIKKVIDVDLLKDQPMILDDSMVSNFDAFSSELPATSTPVKEDKKLQQKNKRLHRPESCDVKNNDPMKEKPIDAPVSKWLRELKLRCEPECMTTLQAKALNRDRRKRSIDITIPVVSSHSIQSFKHYTSIIVTDFAKIHEQISLADKRYEEQLRNLINRLMEFVMSSSHWITQMDSNGRENLLQLMNKCDRLRQFELSDPQAYRNEIQILEKTFTRFMDSLLVQQIMYLLEVLENSSCETALINSLSGIVDLISSLPYTRQIVIYCDGVEKLLVICSQLCTSTIRTLALRALSILCQNAESVIRLEKVNGVTIISRLLSEISLEESELLEVISVLVQITAPWLENQHVIRGLTNHLYPVLNTLTCLIANTDSSEMLLLAIAAIGNIVLIETTAVWIILELDTVGYVLTAVRTLGAGASIFLQEQAATFIANMSAIAETRTHLAQHRVVGALLCFLQTKHVPLQSDVEKAAVERLQHKSSIALSRLCTDTEISKQVIELQGVNRLVKLCREEKERNFNDGVLVACLTALRKITANCGNDVVIQLNAKELVEPRLVDSFLLYSSRQESYV